MIDIEELEGPVPFNLGLPLTVYVPNREADEKAGCAPMPDSHYRNYHITCGCSLCTNENVDEKGYTYASVNIYDVTEASENWDENGKIIDQDYALRFAKLLASAPTLLAENKQMDAELFWLTDSMDDDQRNDTDRLKERAVHPSIADFVQRLAEWGFNNCDNGYVWEAMCAVIEAGERGDLDDLIGCYDDDEADEYFKHKEAIE